MRSGGVLERGGVQNFVLFSLRRTVREISAFSRTMAGGNFAKFDGVSAKKSLTEVRFSVHNSGTSGSIEMGLPGLSCQLNVGLSVFFPYIRFLRVTLVQLPENFSYF